MIFFYFFFPSSFLCRSLLSIPVGWKQHGGEPCKELHVPEQHPLASPCLPFPLGTCSPRCRRCFPLEDVAEGPRCLSAKCQMVHSHRTRVTAWRHVAALAWGWSASGQPHTAWGRLAGGMGQLRGCSCSSRREEHWGERKGDKSHPAAVPVFPMHSSPLSSGCS